MPVTATRLADENHAVVTVEGGGGHYRRRVCSTCPWRKDAVGVFPAEAFRLSANTGMDGGCVTDIDEAMHTFGCHKSGKEKPATCAGYVLQATDSIGWRIAALMRKFDPSQVRRGPEDLHDSYYDMAVANGVPPGDPAIAGCRPWSAPPAPETAKEAN